MQSLDLNNPIPRFMGEFHFHVWQYIAKTNNFENVRALDDYIYSGGTLSEYEVAIIANLYEKHCIDNGIVATPDFIRYLQSLKSEDMKRKEQRAFEQLESRFEKAKASNTPIQIDENSFFDPKNRTIGFNCRGVLRKKTITD